jgi:regulator of sirC expression with transglutaminase-like and TPR domain
VDAYGRFVELIQGPDAALPLGEAALLVAAHANPGLDVARYLDRLDELATTCPGPTLDLLVDHLFSPGGHGFSGNRVDYYDPRNSLLDHVLDRRLGIPISLSVLALDIGRRIGVPLDGVGMPGHFLLRDRVDHRVFVDPFHGGRQLDAVGCRLLFRQNAGPHAPWLDSYLEPVPRRAIITRMLANLRLIYDKRGDVPARRWVRRLRCAFPDAAPEERAELARLMAPLN